LFKDLLDAAEEEAKGNGLDTTKNSMFT